MKFTQEFRPAYAIYVEFPFPLFCLANAIMTNSMFCKLTRFHENVKRSSQKKNNTLQKGFFRIVGSDLDWAHALGIYFGIKIFMVFV